MDLMIDQTAFEQASNELRSKCQELRELRRSIETSFAQLKLEWDTDAGKVFFNRFENDLLKNLEKYSTVFEYMSTNLITSMHKYEEVFGAANTVANSQY